MKINSLNNTRLPRKVAKGFAILEALVGIMIGAIFATSLFAGISMGFSQIGMTRENLRAMQIVAEKFETLRLYSWDQINTPDFIPSTFQATYVPGETNRTSKIFNGTVSIEAAPSTVNYTNDIRLVTVEVTWDSSSGTQTNRLSTLVSEHGIQNYVY